MSGNKRARMIKNVTTTPNGLKVIPVQRKIATSPLFPLADMDASSPNNSNPTFSYVD